MNSTDRALVESSIQKMEKELFELFRLNVDLKVDFIKNVKQIPSQKNAPHIIQNDLRIEDLRNRIKNLRQIL